MKKRFASRAALALVLIAFAGTAFAKAKKEKKPKAPKAKKGAAAAVAMPQYTQSGWKSAKIIGGGMIPGIIYNTSQKGVAYVRTDMGGAYRFDPQSESWIPLTDFAGYEDYGRLGIASLATDPVEPNRLVIASGTYTNDWDPTPMEMLVSEDYGGHFTRVPMHKSDGTPMKIGGNMPGRGCGERLAIDPNNNKVIYFGSNGDGLWRSRDYGHTWEEVKSFPTKGNVYDEGFATYQGGFKHYFGILWVIFDPKSGAKGSDTKNIYVGVADTGDCIYESNDAGATWHPLAGQPAIGEDLTNPPFSKELAESIKGPHPHMTGDACSCRKYYPIKGVYSPKGELLVAYNHGFGPFSSSYWGGAIWKYNFELQSWTDISLPKHDPDPSRVTLDRGVGSVAVDWQNPDNLVAVTLNEWWPDEYIYRSTDGGANWDPIWHMDGWPNRVDKYTLDIKDSPWLDWGEEKSLPEENPKLGWCIADIEIDPFDSDTMMYVTGATIYGTHNLTAWDKSKYVKFTVMADGIEECAILDLISPPEGVHLISGMGDIGGFVHYDLTKAGSMIVNPKITSVSCVEFASKKPSFIIRMGDGLLMYSENGGKDWMPAVTYIEDADKGWGGSAAVAADASVIIWAPSNLVPCWSDDLGRRWVECKGLPKGCKIAADRVNSKKFYAYGYDGKADTFFASEDGGASFKAVCSTWKANNEWPNATDFTSVLGCEGHLWFAGGKAGLYHSEDGGKTWTQIQGVEDAQTIGLGKAKDEGSYQSLYTNSKINGKYGIYRSDDKGATWTRINDDQHQFGAANSTITGDPRIYGRVYLGTNGRGIMYRDLE